MSLSLAPLSPNPYYMCYMCYIANPLTSTLPRLLTICDVLYLTRQPTEHPLSPVPCYICYMCYILQGNPLNIHSPRVLCYMCYMCYILTRENLHCIAHIIRIARNPGRVGSVGRLVRIAHIVQKARNPARVDVQWVAL